VRYHALMRSSDMLRSYPIVEAFGDGGTEDTETTETTINTEITEIAEYSTRRRTPTAEGRTDQKTSQSRTPLVCFLIGSP